MCFKMMFLWFILCVSSVLAVAVPDGSDGESSNVTDQDYILNECFLQDYEATCKLKILDETIEVTVQVNHCHVPLDITFYLVYRFGTGASHHWQYTFVTTNQNERILIDGLRLANAPEALVYLYVRVPQPLFELHNVSIAAIEGSLVASVTANEREEVEFINDSVLVHDVEKCSSQGGHLANVIHHLTNKMYIYIGIICLLLGLATAGSLGGYLLYRRKKRMADQLVLVQSLETGLPGSEPYQLGPNQTQTPISKAAQPQAQPPPTTNESKLKIKGLISGFKFGRLKEETGNESESQTGNSSEILRQKAARKMEKAVVIGNPVLVDKTAMFSGGDGCNGSSSTGRAGDRSENQTENNNQSGTLKNMNADDDCKEGEYPEKKWKMHPLESATGGNESHVTKAGSSLQAPQEDIELEPK